ncbi:MAG: asparagine synthase-related protein [Streptosporangiaceae bacterium]
MLPPPARSSAGQPTADQPFPLGAVAYEDATGTRSRDISQLLGPRPRYSLAKLAAYFTGPAMYRDFRPDCPWAGIRLLRAPPPEPGGGSTGAFRDAFGSAVRDAMDDHPSVAVAFSGGMDSAAVLYTAWRVCQQEGRRLVAVTLAEDDDEGRRTQDVARSVAGALAIGCELAVVDDQAARWPEPAWTPLGPRFDAEPRLHRALAETARGAGAGVLLHGHGADQMLRSPRFMTGELMAARRPAAAARYAADRRASRELGAEGAALAARAMRAAPGATAYLTFARKDLAEPASPVLTAAAAAAARQWLAGTVTSLRADHARRGRSWATAGAVDALFPIDALDPSTELPEPAPFLAPPVAASAWRIRLTKRYGETLPTPYFRAKSLVLGLMPGQVQQALVGHRQRGYLAYSRYWQAAGTQAPRLEALGLVRPGWLAHCRSAFDAAMVHACENWVTGAEERGAEPDGQGL